MRACMLCVLAVRACVCVRVCKREKDRDGGGGGGWEAYLDAFIVVSKLVGATLHVLERAEVVDQELSSTCEHILHILAEWLRATYG